MWWWWVMHFMLELSCDMWLLNVQNWKPISSWILCYGRWHHALMCRYNSSMRECNKAAWPSCFLLVFVYYRVQYNFEIVPRKLQAARMVIRLYFMIKMPCMELTRYMEQFWLWHFVVVNCINITLWFLAHDSIYAIARSLLSPVRLSVCLSVCPSHRWISQRRLKLGSRNLHHSVAPWL